MDFESYVSCLTLAVVLLTHGVCGGEEHSGDDQTLQDVLLKRMDNIQAQLADATRSMGALNGDIEKALLNCIGIRSELCEALEIEAGLKTRADLSSYWGPGKRAAVSANPQVNKFLAELRRKRAMANHLTAVLTRADNVLRKEKKRSCSLNLGFHCQTEDISNFADMYDFLSSPMSPGKKKRSAHMPGRSVLRGLRQVAVTQ